MGLSELGHRVARTLVLPHAEAVFRQLQPILESEKHSAVWEEAFCVFEALQHACASCLYASASEKYTPSPDSSDIQNGSQHVLIGLTFGIFLSQVCKL